MADDEFEHEDEIEDEDGWSEDAEMDAEAGIQPVTGDLLRATARDTGVDPLALATTQRFRWDGAASTDADVIARVQRWAAATGNEQPPPD